jgi:hypothetical protein
MSKMNPDTLREIEEYIGARFESRFGERFKRYLVDEITRELRQKVLNNMEFRMSRLEARLSAIEAKGSK